MNRWTRVVTVAAIGSLALVAAPSSRSQVSLVPVRIIAFNDFHGHLEAGENVVEVPDPSDPSRKRRVRAGGAAHLATLVARLDRRMDFDLAVSDRTMYLSLGQDTLTGVVHERRLEA